MSIKSTKGEPTYGAVILALTQAIPAPGDDSELYDCVMIAIQCVAEAAIRSNTKINKDDEE